MLSRTCRAAAAARLAVAAGTLLARIGRAHAPRSRTRTALPRAAAHRRRLVLGAGPQFRFTYLVRRAARAVGHRRRCDAARPRAVGDAGLRPRRRDELDAAPRRPGGAPALRRPAGAPPRRRRGARALHSISGEPRFDAARRLRRLLGRRRATSPTRSEAQRAIAVERDALSRAVRALAVAAAAAPPAASSSMPTPPRRACSASPTPRR